MRTGGEREGGGGRARAASAPVMTKVNALADHVVQLDQEGIGQYVRSMRGTLDHRLWMAGKL